MSSFLLFLKYQLNNFIFFSNCSLRVISRYYILIILILEIDDLIEIDIYTDSRIFHS